MLTKESMKFPKYKRGDSVQTVYGSRATIKEWLKGSLGEDRYKIQYKDTPTMVEVPETDLKFDTTDLKDAPKNKNVGSHCPKCHSKWKITHIGTTKYYDCTKCNKKAEDILSSEASPKEYSRSSWESSSFDDDFGRDMQSLLDDWDVF